MTPAPTVSNAALELYEALDPAFTDGDEDRGWPTLILCDVLTAGDVARLHDYVTDQDDGTPGWVILLDPDRAPVETLPWLAQFVGATLRPDMNEAQRRAAIKAPEAFGRGTRDAIIAVAQRRLTGVKRVILDERSDGTIGVDKPWQMRIRTLVAETPDPAATEREIRAEQKPIGIVLTYAAIDGQTWGDVKANYATWADVEAAYANWGEVATDLP